MAQRWRSASLVRGAQSHSNLEQGVIEIVWKRISRLGLFAAVNQRNYVFLLGIIIYI